MQRYKKKISNKQGFRTKKKLKKLKSHYKEFNKKAYCLILTLK